MATYDIVAESSTINEVLWLESSWDRYQEYKRVNADILEDNGITDENWLRTPNGKGDLQGTWTPPYTQLDIWDYHLNTERSSNGEITIIDDPSRYIPLPLSADDLQYGGYVDPVSGLYPEKYLRLWDFIYNQEFFLNAETEQRPRRNRAFPTRRQDMAPIVPEYLPDATMPVEFQLRYPYAAWEDAVYSDAEIRRQAQRYNYVKAHSGKKEESAVNVYSFEPYDATLEYNPLIRPIYHRDENYSPINYGPIVLRNVEAHTTNGWLSFYRQQLKLQSTNTSISEAPRIREWYDRAKFLQEQSPATPLTTIVFSILKKEADYLWPSSVDRPVEELYRPARYDKVEQQFRPLNAKESEAFNTISYLYNLLKSTQAPGSDVPYILDFDTTDVVQTPVFYSDPYKIIVLQVRVSQRNLHAFSTSFSGVRSWIVSVPPVLSAVALRTIDVQKTRESVSWYSDDEPGGKLTVSLLPDAPHQANVEIQALGEYTIRCSAQNQHFQYELASVSMSVKRVVFPLEEGDTLYYFDDGSRWSGIRFSSKDLADTRDRSLSWMTDYLASHWSRDLLSPQNISVVKNVRGVPQLDYTRPLLLVHAYKDRTAWQLIVFEFASREQYIHAFGEDVVLKMQLPASVRSVFRLVWKSFDDSPLIGEEPVITVVMPQQLQWYRAEVHTVDAHVFSIYVKLDIRWPFTVPRRYLARKDMDVHYDAAKGWPPVEGAPRRLPSHRDGSLLNYYTPQPEDTGESLATPFEGEFFQALVYCYARYHFVDVQNYARLFPFLVEYAQCMQKIVDDNGDRVEIITSMPDNVRTVLPDHLGFPLLFLRLTDQDEEDLRVQYTYVVYDPLNIRWINIFEPSLILLPAWHVSTSIALRQRVRILFQRSSIEYMQTRHKIASKPASASALPKQKIFKDTKSRSRVENLRLQINQQLQEFNTLNREYLDIVDVEKRRLSSIIVPAQEHIHQVDFLRHVQNVFDYVGYISSVAAKLNVRSLLDAPVDRVILDQRLDDGSDAATAYKLYLDNRVADVSFERVRAELALINVISELRLAVFLPSVRAINPGIAKFVELLFREDHEKYVYSNQVFFDLVSRSFMV